MNDLSLSQIKVFQDHLEEADNYKEQGELEAAIACYQKAIEINSHSASTYYDWGSILLELANWAEATDIFQKSLAINPNFDWCHYNLGEALVNLNRWEEAIFAYQKALDLNSNLPQIHKKLADSFYQRGTIDRESLLEDYRAQIAEDPYKISLYHQAIEVQPQNSDLYLGLGNALVFHNKLDEATVAYQIALQIKPNFKAARIQLEKILQPDDLELGTIAITTENNLQPRNSLQQAKRVVDNLNQIQLNNFLLSDGIIEFTPVSEPIVSIVLVLYNRAELTLSCLHSILHNSFKSLEVIIVDNNSSDRTKALLDKVQGVKFIFNDENRHFLLAANQASQVAQGEYLLFLNNDAQILGDSINQAVQTINEQPDVGAVGGKIILPDGTLQEAGSIVWQDGSCLGYGRGDDPELPQYMFQREVDYCSGAFLLTPRELFTELGCFDDIYQPAYYEETDYCIRLHKAGKKIIYDPQVAILHYEFASSENNEQAIELQEKNQKTFIDQHRIWLQSQYQPDLSNILNASAKKGEQLRILFIDDRIPHPYLGSGYTRSSKMLQIMSNLECLVTFYPTDLSFQENWQNTYKDIPRTIEIAKDWGLQKLEDFLRSRPDFYDLVFVSRPHNMNHLNYILSQENILDGTKIIYDAEALYCLREFALQKLRGKPLSQEEQQAKIQEELEIALNSDLIISVSEAEQQKFLDHGYPSVEILGHSLMTVPTPNIFAKRQSILFVGAIYEIDSPNADSVLWFSRKIFPLIQEELGAEVNFLVVGNNTVPELNKKIAKLNNPGIKMLGRVDNLLQIYNRSRLFIAPTRFAAGIPHKIHEAASYGLPVVTTSAIAKQLSWQNEQELLTANKPQDFANQCIRLYQEEDLWNKLRENALKKIEIQCSPEYFQTKLKEILDRC
ncbi:putative glycosyltransferase [Xenococcus sp. PCC 7305]|uniref:tetratricopeptide repeat protein n=1 Tax=Xenococcus sp. PCC 7305 TaxID=102125 RepID=UPI0002AC8769|nr:tetratricopeptide repeat protein [Xenococcus sp. PCC 7305]ELS01505.1 putative glycosyltransferase [Xenococcus sp. PCC 7305]